MAPAQGRSVVDGRLADEWLCYGQFDNHYYATADAAQVCALRERVLSDAHDAVSPVCIRSCLCAFSSILLSASNRGILLPPAMRLQLMHN